MSVEDNLQDDRYQLNQCIAELESENSTLRQQLAAANARLAAAESVFGKCEKAMQEAIIRVCFIGHPKEPIYMDGERRVPSWSKPLNLMQEARKEIKEGDWLPAEPQQQGGG